MQRSECSFEKNGCPTLPGSNLRDPMIQSERSQDPICGILVSEMRDPGKQFKGSQDPIWVIPGSNLRDSRIQSERSQDPIWGIPGSNLRDPRIQSEISQDPIWGVPGSNLPNTFWSQPSPYSYLLQYGHILNDVSFRQWKLSWISLFHWISGENIFWKAHFNSKIKIQGTV